MSLPEWCQTHSLKEFMEMLETPKEKKMNDTIELAIPTEGETAERVLTLDPAKLEKLDTPTRIRSDIGGEVVGYVQDKDIAG